MRLALRKYPRLAQAMLDRHRMYNRELKAIRELEEQGRIFVIRPDEPVDVGRIERDTVKLHAAHEAGLRKGEAILDDLDKYLQ